MKTTIILALMVLTFASVLKLENKVRAIQAQLAANQTKNIGLGK